MQESKCVCVSYEQVKFEIQQQLKRTALIPVLGSGFTRGCTSQGGKVPSGDDYKDYMIDQIIKKRGYDDSKKSNYENKQFSEISTIYHAIIPKQQQRIYLRNNFTKVELSSDKKNFLDIDWPYVYTLNIDDAIEKNSRYTTVVYSNRELWDEIFVNEKCTIKLHGHIDDILVYEDSKCEIFDLPQYVQSLNDNRVLLDKLKHDYEFLNLIYIGCSLSNEIDLLSIASKAAINGNRYYCTDTQPDEDSLLMLAVYGITHCVIFDSYDAIYTELVASAEEAEKIGKSDLDKYKTFEFTKLQDGFDTNKAYLFHGKTLIDKERRVFLPSFFISREITDKLAKNIKSKGTQILVGSGCSGKTYVTIDLARRIVDRDVFVFQSRERINDDAFSELLLRENCLIITDSKALSVQQIEDIIRSDLERVNRQNSFVIVENKSNRDLISLLSLLKMTDVVKKHELIPDELKNKLTVEKSKELNQKLVKSSFGIFSERKSISDNIIDISTRLVQTNKFDRIVPKMQTVKEVACLIVLATMEKVYSKDVVILNLEEEFILQKREAFPLIEDEGTWNFEISIGNNSPMKYVVNAEFWLYNQLDGLARTKLGRERIIDAYRYIVQKIIEHYGKPDLKRGERNAPYKEYILFDNINQIFATQGNVLIRGIYETLNDLLSTDPNYLHQRAKCYIRSSYITSDFDKKKQWLIQAQRDASSSHKIFEERYIESKNEKAQISTAHALYTLALTLCHLAKLTNYNDMKLNESAIENLYLALSSPYNSMEFIKKDKAYNYDNVIEETIATFVANPSLIPSEKAKMNVAELMKIQIEENLD
ncbi:MAG: hypothetical protein ACLVEN_09840 [Anaerotignum lactatifermentans]|uniref:hypothetical protein n=1 Tax=Anaerotignum lactatifermentans TaxID=160404 RepID=UPI00399A94E6